jgi:hypothetical protein
VSPVPAPSALDAVLPILACPWCKAALHWTDAGLRCVGCEAEFPERSGIFDLARRGTAETWGTADAELSSQEYQDEYAQLNPAMEYNRAYEVRLLKRMSTARERQLIAKLLGTRGRVDTLLELPCGGGRLSPFFAPWARFLIQADTGWGQLLHASQRPPLPTPRILLAASGFHIPVRDGGVDGVVCVRLNHHLPTVDERHRLLHELLRVARSYVLMTFFDQYSMKNRIRQWRRRPPKLTMTSEEVAGIAREHGMKLVADPMLSWLNSGHRYALMVRDS